MVGERIARELDIVMSHVRAAARLQQSFVTGLSDSWAGSIFRNWGRNAWRIALYSWAINLGNQLGQRTLIVGVNPNPVTEHWKGQGKTDWTASLRTYRPVIMFCCIVVELTCSLLFLYFVTPSIAGWR